MTKTDFREWGMDIDLFDAGPAEVPVCDDRDWVKGRRVVLVQDGEAKAYTVIPPEGGCLEGWIEGELVDRMWNINKRSEEAWEHMVEWLGHVTKEAVNG